MHYGSSSSSFLFPVYTQKQLCVAQANGSEWPELKIEVHSNISRKTTVLITAVGWADSAGKFSYEFNSLIQDSSLRLESHSFNISVQ